MTFGTVEVVANQFRTMRPETIPYDQQGLLEMPVQCLEKGHNLFLLDAALVKAKQAVQPTHSGNNRELLPIEMELNHWRLSPGRPSAHPCGPFAQTRLVDKNDQATF